MQNSKKFKKIFPFLLLCTLLVHVNDEPKEQNFASELLTSFVGSSLAIAQNCSDNYIGNATLNEVNDDPINYNNGFVEVKLLDTDIDYTGWFVRICEGNNNITCYDYDLSNADEYGSYLIIEDTEDALSLHSNSRQSSDVSLRDSNGSFVDYLSISGFNEQNPSCSFAFDTDVSAGSDSDGAHRREDGTGSWSSYQKSKQSATPGTSNDGSSELGSFNAFESSTESGNTAGPLYTKISGKEFQIDVVALGGGGNLKTYNGDANLALVNATAGVDCRNLTKLASLGTTTFNSQERKTVTGLSYPHAIGSARIRITEDKNNPKQGCSTDAFTIRPHHLTLEGRDTDWNSSGTNRILDGNNTDVCQKAGGTETCHKAGSNFTLNGTALNSDNASVSTGYNATADVGWVLNAPSGGILGSFNPNSVTFNGSKFRTDNAIYAEVGLVDLHLNDSGRFAVQSGDWDNEDCIRGSSSNTQTNGLYGCQTATQRNQTVGRFVPDHFRVTNGTAPAFCNACFGGAFTYIGQPFYYNDAPIIRLTARNALNNTTRNYGNNFWQFANRTDYLNSRNYTDQANATAFLNVTQVDNATVSGHTDFDGSGNFTLSGNDCLDPTDGDELRYARNGTEAPFGANATLIIDQSDLTDEDGTCYEVNGSCSSYTFENIIGTELRYGRLVLENAYGSELLNLELPIRVEYYQGEGFTTNVEDQCTRLTMGNSTEAVEMELKNEVTDWQPANQTIELSGTNSNGTTLGVGLNEENQNSTTLDDGKGRLILDAPEANNTGYVHVRANLDNHPWLQYDWSGNGNNTDNPNATATFGIYKGNEHIIYQQETTWK